MNFLKAAECAQSVSLIFIILQNKRATFFATLLQKELNSNHIPPSTNHEKKPCNLIASLCGQRWKGKGKGEFGRGRGRFSSRVPKFPLPLPLSTPDTQTTLLQDSLRTWVVLEKRNIAIQLVMRQCCKTNCVLVRVASWVKRQVSRYVLRHCFTDCLMLGTKATNIK